MKILDVLRSSEIRDGIKAFSQWPTIPQLYVDGKFIGGCDIIREMNGSGDLQKLIGVQVSERSTPKITMSEAELAAPIELLDYPDSDLWGEASVRSERYSGAAPN